MDAASGGDKRGLWNFLERRGLSLQRSTHSSDTTHLANADGSVLLFDDGYPRDLILSDPSIHGSELSAFIAHAHLSDDECELLYDLCVSTNFLLVHVDAPPAVRHPGWESPDRPAATRGEG